jgi:hypothetical protein
LLGNQQPDRILTLITPTAERHARVLGKPVANDLIEDQRPAVRISEIQVLRTERHAQPRDLMLNTQDPERTNWNAGRQAVTDLTQNLRQRLERQRERKPGRSVPVGSVAPDLGCNEPHKYGFRVRRPGSRQPTDSIAVKLLRKRIQHARVRAAACGPTLRPHRDRGLREPDGTVLVNQPKKPIRNRD